MPPSSSYLPPYRIAIRLSHARSVSAVALLSGPRTTDTRTSSPSRRTVTADPAPLPCPTRRCIMRRISASSPLISVPPPGSIDTRASGATSHMSDARSIRPRRPRAAEGTL